MCKGRAMELLYHTLKVNVKIQDPRLDPSYTLFTFPEECTIKGVNPLE